MSQIKVNSIVPTGGLPAGANGGIIQIVYAETTTKVSTTSGNYVDSGVTATITPIGMKLEGIPMADSFPVVAPFATVTVATYVDSVISLVREPVVELLMMFLNPFSERTGPEKVVLAM